MSEPLIESLLATSMVYVQARREFEAAIRAARRQGWPDAEIAHRIGLSRDAIESVAGRRRS
jgi:DNA-directed RNA polymerase specialized sigma24 family protein